MNNSNHNIYTQNLQSSLGERPNITLRNAHRDLANYIHFLLQVKEQLATRAAIEVKLKKVIIPKTTLGDQLAKLKVQDTKNGFEYQITNKGNKKEIEQLEKELFKNEIGELYITPIAEVNTRDRTDRIKILDRSEDEYKLWIDRNLGEKTMLFIRQDNSQIQKKIAALKRLQNKPLKEHLPLLRLFDDPYYQKFDSYLRCLGISEWYILKDDSRNGTSEQRDFVKKSLESADFALLEGPPGSGKTTTILELILQLCIRGKKVLLVSSTHVAVDNVLKRVLADDTFQEYIAPVRIARNKSQIRYEVVKSYRLQELVQSKKKEVRQYLQAIDERTESQTAFLAAVQNSQDDKYFERAILDASNLVCGTTIGVLQHPAIKKGTIDVPFDVMIVDEASKVTFQEFLVPALYAKKWILVGDVQQLSPYVEDEQVEIALDDLITYEQKKTILSKFYADRKYKNEDVIWSSELAHRLNQYYAFRLSPELGKHIKRDIDLLAPSTIIVDRKRGKTLTDEVERIQQIAMPSILELLQNGLGERTNRNGRKIDRILYDGFPKEAKKYKFVSLSYQHRMETEIAQTSKDHFYQNNNLQRANTIEKRINVLATYRQKEDVVIWIPNKGRNEKERKVRVNRNEYEANQILREIKYFLEWSKQADSKDNGDPFELAVLCFYKDQVALVQKKLQDLFQQEMKAPYRPKKTFLFHRTKVVLCTVDKFQGDEADMVLLSFTKASRNAFYKSPNRLNVALTRARHKLILFGNRRFFADKNISKALTVLAQYSERLSTKLSK